MAVKKAKTTRVRDLKVGKVTAPQAGKVKGGQVNSGGHAGGGSGGGAGKTQPKI